MRILLKDLSPGQEYAVQFRLNIDDRVSKWSEIDYFISDSTTKTFVFEDDADSVDVRLSKT